ncbi:gamma-type small acid-soluble spore protein [Peribacillus sp. JNUCC 23]
MVKKSKAGTDIQQVQKQNNAQGQYGTEFASETNVQEVKQQNQQAQAGKSYGQANAQAQGQYGTEFASETNVQEVQKQNQQAEAKKNRNGQS